MKALPRIYNQKLDPQTEKLLEHVFQDRMEYLGLMSSALVHQLQIPLVIMRGRIETYLRHPEKSSQQALLDISKESQYLLKLLESMIFPPAKSKEIQFEVIDLKEVVDKVLILFQGACLELGISVNVEISQGIKVQSERNRLKNILISLLSNAIESFANVKQSQVKNILIHTKSDQQGIHLVISDTGCGMSVEVQNKLLTEAFFSTKEQQGSSGMGLSLSRKIAADLKIELSFISQIGTGTSFSLRFPRNIYSLESESISSSESEAKS